MKAFKVILFTLLAVISLAATSSGGTYKYKYVLKKTMSLNPDRADYSYWEFSCKDYAKDTLFTSDRMIIDVFVDINKHKPVEYSIGLFFVSAGNLNGADSCDITVERYGYLFGIDGDDLLPTYNITDEYVYATNSIINNGFIILKGEEDDVRSLHIRVIIKPFGGSEAQAIQLKKVKIKLNEL
ncbi:MAG TPA: hypothetical protein PLA88_03115 [Bacteroidales bacterium]|nr:hypothetical protein [Bacteroidales bacterium]